MPRGDVVTAWGATVSVSSAPHSRVESGVNWEIWRKANDDLFALVWTGTQTLGNYPHPGKLGFLRNWAQERAESGDEEEPPAPPLPSYLAITSSPSSAKIYLSHAYTGFLTPHTFEVSEGRVHVKVGKTGFVYLSREVDVPFEAQWAAFFELEPVEEEPPIEEPPEEPPTPPPYSVVEMFNDFIDWWEAVAIGNETLAGDIVRTITGRKSTILSSSDKRTAEEKLRDEMPFLALGLVGAGAPIKLVKPAAAALGKQLAKMGADEFLALATKNPAQALRLIKAATEPQLVQLMKSADNPYIKEKVWETATRLVLDSRAGPQIMKYLKLAGAGTVGFFGLAYLLNFLGFLAEESIQTRGIGVFELIANKEWKLASQSIIDYEQSVNALSAGVDGLMNIPFLNMFLAHWWPGYKNSALAQVEDYKALINAKLVEETPENTGILILNTDPVEVLARTATEQKFYTSGTPWTMMRGQQDIVIEKEGFIPRMIKPIIRAGETETLSVILEQIPGEITAGTGRLQILIYDAVTNASIGATLLINGRAEAYSLSSFVLDLVPGPYEIRIQKVGYLFYDDTVSIEEGQTTGLVVKLEKIPPLEPPTLPDLPEEEEPEPQPMGRVEISSDPIASVWILGEQKAKTTPTVLELIPGVYDITLKSEGYENVTQRVWLHAEEIERISITLRKIEEPPLERYLARVNINCSVTGAKILINGEFTNKYCPDYILLEEGEYMLSLQKSGYKTWSTPLRIVRE